MPRPLTASGDEAPTILIAARDEEARIGETIAALRRELPDAEVIVADDGSRDRTALVAEQAGARVVRLPRRGKGQALTVAEREAPAGPLLLCDADVQGALAPLLASAADLTVAAFAERQGGGFGVAKRAARALIRMRTGFEPREPLSGQRALSERARNASFPLAAGFGCEVGMTIDALCAGLTIRELELPLATAPPVATWPASLTVGDSFSTRCSRSARRASIIGGSAFRSSAGRSGSREGRLPRRSPPPGSPTICGAGPSEGFAPIFARVGRRAC